LRKIKIKIGFFLPLILIFLNTGLFGCEDSGDTAVDLGCEKDSDCPLVDRQKCKVDLGICVGHTTLPGDIDGGSEVEDADIYDQ
jgi:hypothetical protein